VALGIKVGQLTITESVIWLGARVSVAVGEEVAARKAPEKKAPEKKALPPKAPAS
jgi:hypothetical protein